MQRTSLSLPFIKKSWSLGDGKHILLRPQLSQAIASQFAAVAEHRLLLPRGTFLWDWCSQFVHMKIWFVFFFRIKTTFDTKLTQILHLVKQEMSTTPELSIQELIYPQDEEGIPFRCPNLKSWESCLERFVGFVGVARLFNPHGKYIVKLFVQGKWRKASTWVFECFLNARQWTCQFQGADWRRGPNRLRNAWEQYVRRRLSSDLSLFLLLRVKLHLQPVGVSARRLLFCPRVTTTTSFGRSYLLKPCPVLKWPIT